MSKGKLDNYKCDGQISVFDYLETLPCAFSGHTCNKKELWKVADTLDDLMCPHVCCRKCNTRLCGVRCNGSEEPKQPVNIKGNRWLLLTNSEEIEGMNAMRLHDILYSFPKLKEPYEIKERFRDIYLFSKTREEAEQAFEEWKTTINDYPEYLAFADTVENWRTEIFNYFDFRFTNAVTESLNKVSKEISAQGRGYNFNVLRAKILYRNQAAKPAKFAYHGLLRPSTGVMQDMTFRFSTPFFEKKKSVEVGAGTDIDILSEQINDIVEIRQRLGRINRYANKFKYCDEPKEDKK